MIMFICTPFLVLNMFPFRFVQHIMDTNRMDNSHCKSPERKRSRAERMKFQPGHEVWAFHSRAKKWEPGTMYSGFETDLKCEVTLRNDIKLESTVDEIRERDFIKIASASAVINNQSWVTNLYRRPQVCLGGLGRDGALALMRRAHPKDPYWQDDLARQRELDEQKVVSLFKKVELQKRKLKKTKRMNRMLDFKSTQLGNSRSSKKEQFSKTGHVPVLSCDPFLQCTVCAQLRIL